MFGIEILQTCSNYNAKSVEKYKSDGRPSERSDVFTNDWEAHVPHVMHQA